MNPRLVIQILTPDICMCEFVSNKGRASPHHTGFIDCFSLTLRDRRIIKLCEGTVIMMIEILMMKISLIISSLMNTADLALSCIKFEDISY